MQVMKKLVSTIVAVGSLFVVSCSADEPARVQSRVDVPTEDVVAHDPVIIKEADTYYLFTTGPGISVWTSPDKEKWTMKRPVFDPVPRWTKETVPGFNGHMWAPDISFHSGAYYLYYSVSSFGSNDSCIGLATNRTLDQDSPDYEWVDRGIVVRSEPGINNWNAIDPNLVFTKEGQPYLAFGSFWSGLKLIELVDDLDAPRHPGQEPLSIASRVQVPAPEGEGGAAPLEPGNTAIEGPFVYLNGEYYYLFASIDFCCRGKDSTYKMIYGRAKSVEGPYLDREGRRLLDGGGTILLQGDERWHGVGHNAVCELDGTEYTIFHGYDGNTSRGLPKLHIEALAWTPDGWPYILDRN